MSSLVALSIFAMWTAASTPEAVSAGAAQPGDQRPADVRAIRAHIEQIFEAYAKKDRPAVRRTHAVEWRGFLRNSPGVIRGIDEYMRQAEGALGGSFQLSSHTFRDFDVIFYGPIAVVSYVTDIVWTKEAQQSTDTLRIQDVYARQDAGWMQVASHVAQSPAAQEPPKN